MKACSANALFAAVIASWASFGTPDSLRGFCFGATAAVGSITRDVIASPSASLPRFTIRYVNAIGASSAESLAFKFVTVMTAFARSTRNRKSAVAMI